METTTTITAKAAMMRWREAKSTRSTAACTRALKGPCPPAMALLRRRHDLVHQLGVDLLLELVDHVGGCRAHLADELRAGRLELHAALLQLLQGFGVGLRRVGALAL